jgi:hypothetical protein
MNRMQKIAWWTLISILAGVIASGAAVAVCYLIIGMPIHRALGGLGFICIAGVAGFGPLIFRQDKGKIICDERDKLINSRAALASFTVAYLVTGVACMLPFFIRGSQATISIIWLPTIYGGAGLTAFIVYSVMILAQYGWRDKDGR